MYSKCQKCGKKLTDPESIKRGYGPECWNSLTAHYYRSLLTGKTTEYLGR